MILNAFALVAINGRYGSQEKSHSGDSGKASSESSESETVPTLEELIQKRNTERAEERARAEKEEFQDMDEFRV